jgi:hypothetical protein
MLAGLRDLLKSKFESVFMVADAGSFIEAAEKLEPDITVGDLPYRSRKRATSHSVRKKLFLGSD